MPSLTAEVLAVLDIRYRTVVWELLPHLQLETIEHHDNECVIRRHADRFGIPLPALFNYLVLQTFILTFDPVLSGSRNELAQRLGMDVGELEYYIAIRQPALRALLPILDE